MIPDNVLMGVLLVTGTLMFAGVVHQVWSGILRHRGSPASGHAHKIIGYSVLVLALLHLPLGVLDAIEAFAS